MRIEQVNETILRQLSEILLRELDFSLETFVTITKVETTADKSMARVSLQVLPETAGPKVLRQIVKGAPYFRSLLSQKVRGRHVPELRFALDDNSEIKTLENQNQ